MRQIKFRGKRTDTGEWIYGDLLTSNGTECEISDWNDVVYSRYDVEPNTVGQFTGLLDKNGKKIYEGDAIAYGNHSGIIIYLDCYATFALKENIRGTTVHIYPLFQNDIEIIDNPQLPKGGKE